MLSVLVPHLNYIKVLIYRGYPLETTPRVIGVKERLIQENFNAISDEDYQAIYDEIMANDWAIEMIEENAEILDHNFGVSLVKQKYPKSHENIRTQFRSGQRFEEALIADVSLMTKTAIKRRGYFLKAKNILYDRRMRSYLENSLTLHLSLKEITNEWNTNSPSNEKLAYNTISQYSYFFWNVRSKENYHVSVDGRLAIKRYLNLDRDNFFYDDHRTLVFSNRKEYRQVFGIITPAERAEGKNQMLGSLYKYINGELTSNNKKPIRKDFLDFFMYLDKQAVMRNRMFLVMKTMLPS